MKVNCVPKEIPDVIFSPIESMKGMIRANVFARTTIGAA